MKRRCEICDAEGEPTALLVANLAGLDNESRVHRACWRAWADSDKETLIRLRKEACEAGHHRWPGVWTRDPADPYGDAQFWECAKGCGHVQRHPGYGHGRAVAEMEAAQRAEQAARPVEVFQPSLFDEVGA